MKIETVKLSKLKPYEKNSRTHSDDQIEKVARSITEFGMCNPILVDSDLMIIAGHARLAALKKLGHKEVPVIYLDHLTDAQKRAYVIADNQLATDAGWDETILRDELLRLETESFDLGLLGFEQSFLSDLMTSQEEKQRRDEVEDVVPEVKKD